MNNPFNYRRGRTFTGVGLLVGLTMITAAWGGNDKSSGRAPETTEATRDDPAESEPIVIGVSAAQSGQLAGAGTQMLNGMELAVDLINSDGGVDGRPLELIVEDDAGDPALAGQFAEEFGENEDVVAILGSYGSGPSLAQSEIFEEYGLPGVYNQASSGQMVARGLEYVFNTYPLANEEMANTAAYLVRLDAVQSAAILWVNNEYGEDGRSGILSELEPAGVEIVVDESFEIADTDFTSVAQRIAGADPDLVWLVGYGHNHVGLMQSLKQQDFSPDVYCAPGGVDFQASVTESLGADADWVVMAPLWWPGVDRPGETEARESYADAYGQEIGAEAVNGFIGVQVLAQSMSGLDEITRDSVADALRNVTADTLSGTLVFDERGQAVWDIPVVQLQNGEFVVLSQDGEDLAPPAPFVPWSER